MMLISYAKNMPKGTINIHFIQLFSVVGFAALLPTLNLYLQSKGISAIHANTMTASFFGLNFMLHFISGSLGGRWLSYRSLLTVSLTLQIIGLLAISASTLSTILVGMGFFVVGGGLLVGSINMILTQLFDKSDIRRRTAFSIQYGIMNIGFGAAYILTDILQSKNNYAAIFITAAVSIAISLVIHFLAWRHFDDKGTFFAQQSKANRLRLLATTTVAACLVAALFLMHHPKLAANLVYAVYALVTVLLLRFTLHLPTYQRNRIWAYMILVLTGMLYAFCQGLMSTGLVNFVQYNTNMSLFGIHIETGGFSLFESLGVVIFSWILASISNRQKGTVHVNPAENIICRGLALSAIAFLFIPIGIVAMHIFGTAKVQLLFPIILLLFVAAAEVHLNATNYAMPGELGEVKLQGILTGYLFLNIAIGINLSGPFSNMIIGQYGNLSKAPIAQTNPMYLKAFMMLFVISLVITVLYILLRPLIRHLRLSGKSS